LRREKSGKGKRRNRASSDRWDKLLKTGPARRRSPSPAIFDQTKKNDQRGIKKMMPLNS